MIYTVIRVYCVCVLLFLSIKIQQKATTTSHYHRHQKRATEANGFKQYLIISVIQRQLRLNYHAQNGCVGFGHGQVFARGPLHGKHTTYVYAMYTYSNIRSPILLFSHCFCIILSVFTKGLCIHSMQTVREGEKQRKSREKNLLNFLCTHTMAMYIMSM